MVARQLGHFRVEGPLGSGGMGEVYRARDERLDREVAVKVLPEAVASDPERLARFEREAKALAHLSHPNILAIHEFGREGDVVFAVTELLHGETLGHRLSRERLPWRRAVEIAAAVADGLAAAHAQGVVHRDLKPENLFLTSDGQVRILDFGVARFDAEAPGEAETLAGPSSSTKPGILLGTLGYMSPEQAVGEPADSRSDIFALGCVLFEMLTGRRAFARGTVGETLRAIQTEPVPDVDGLGLGIPADVGRIVAHCLEKEPQQRFQSARDLAFDLRATLTSALSVVAGVPASPGRRRLPRWLAWTGVALVALAVAGAAWLALRHPGPGPDATGTPAEGRRRIVVLPFENLGASEDEYFAAGMTEEITSRLAGVQALGVTSRTTAREYDRRGKTLRKVGADLGVDFVLEGTVRWDRSQGSPGRVRITPQLIRVADDTHLWAATYERQMSDVFALQSEVAEEVARALGATLSASEARAVGRVPTRDLAAHDLYLRALRLGSESYDRRDLEEAIRLLEQAIALDPGFAEAHAQLAEQHLQMYWFHHDRTPARVEQARRSAERAAELAPDLVETHLAMANYHYRGHLDYERALAEIALARRLRPADGETLFLEGSVRRRMGQLEEAAELYERAAALDPGNAARAHDLASTYWLLRRYPDADRVYERTLALSPRWGYVCSNWAGMRLCWHGDVAEARSILARVPPGADVREPEWLAFRLVWLDLLERRYDQALAHLRALSLPAFSTQFFYVPLSRLAGDASRFMGHPEAAREDYLAALAVVERELVARPEDSRLFSAKGLVLAGLDRKEEALRAAQTGVDLMPIAREAIQGTFRAEDLARVEAMVGRPEAAIDTLEMLLARPSSVCAWSVRLDPAWDPLRRHPRFEALLRRQGVTP
jgi:serine/threonine-protein kinase